MQALVVTNRKGGTGKTTLTVNLAAELARSGQRVLLIDLDSQGHCAVALGIEVRREHATVHDLFTTPEATLSDCLCETGIANLWLAPADPLFDHGDGERNDSRLRQALSEEHLASRFDVVLIDTPPSLDALLVNGLMAARHVLVPFVPHHLSFEGVRQLARSLYPVMTKHNRQLKILGFVPMMAAEYIRQHREVTNRVGHDFGEAKILPAIRNDIRLAEATAVGKSIRQYSPRCRGAQDFAALARDISERLGLNARLARTA